MSTRSWTATIVALAAGIGLALYATAAFLDSAAWVFGIVLGLSIGGMAFVLSATPQRWRLPGAASLVIVGVIAVAVAGSLARFYAIHTGQDYATPIKLAIQCVLFGLIAITFVQARQSGKDCRGTTGRFPIAYEHFAGHAWRNGLIVATSLWFAGLFWVLVWLFATLLRRMALPDIPYPAAWPPFIPALSCGAFALCVLLIRRHEQIVAVTRNIAFGLFTALVPVFLILSAGVLTILLLGKFLHMAYAVSASAALIGLVGLGLFSVNTATILIVLVGFGLIAVNAVIRDRKAKDRPSVFMQVSAVLLLPLLLLFAGFAVHAVALRIDQYGLTPDRIFGAVTTGVLLLWCLGFLACLVAGRRWAIYCRRVNIAMALTIAGLTLTLQTPLADPYRLSAESQYRRLTDGVADPKRFDYRYLQSKLGAAGWKALRRIAEDSGKADPAVVAEHLDDLHDHTKAWTLPLTPEENDWSVRAGAALADADRVRRVPATLTLPEDIGADTFHEHMAREVVGCGIPGRFECLITPVDVTDAPGSEFLLGYRDGDGTLTLLLLERLANVGGWHADVVLTRWKGDALWSALMRQDIQAVPPRRKNLRVGDETIELYQRYDH